MKRTTLILTASGAALLAAWTGNALAQQVYKWKDAKGVTHYSDTPPPAREQKQVQVKAYSATGGSVDVPFALAQAMRGAPVTIFTTAGCGACDNARAALVERGIPYTEKTVSSLEDTEQLKLAGGSDQLPFITIGRTRLTGFEPGSLHAALNAAAYPKQRVVGPSFRLGTVMAAALPPPPPPPAPKEPEPPANAKVPPAPAFQF
ncbi:MAG TPA: glutaredoxin family protein [Telluria sp.]|nr:glutaredoxin family protein [Telluria sp.]